MTTVAEGVEEPAQLAMLARLGCTSVQGYLFARPLVPGEVLGAADRARDHIDKVVVPLRSVG
jgi:EAL domain-containing protein (putative c-di-GMP-specific phosphodiesterase class I)